MAPATTARSRVGRPSPQRVEAIKTQILDAALSAFLALGFEAASMEAIALAAKVSKATLYARYPNKAALAGAVLERESETWGERQRREWGDVPTDPRLRLRHHVKIMIASLNSPEVRAFRDLLRGAGTPDTDLARNFSNIGYSSRLQNYADAFADLARDLPDGARQPEMAAEMLMAMLLGWHHVKSFEVGGASPEAAAEFADRVIDIVLAGRAAW